MKLPSQVVVEVGSHRPHLLLVRNLRARRYILRVQPDGTVRVTIPRGGSEAEARSFMSKNLNWLQQRLDAVCSHKSAEWTIGTNIFFRGELVKIDADEGGKSVVLRTSSELLKIPLTSGRIRSAIENYLRQIADSELPQKVHEFASSYKLRVRRVAVRAQRTRWGSCSRTGTISLNWRLIQMPTFVRDYIVIHEVMHLREMNHSRRFWTEVKRACPQYETARSWLKQHRIQIS